MRLVICDGNRIFGEAFADALGWCDNDLKAVAVTVADECVATVASYAPDMCVLDVRVPEAAAGLRLIEEIRSRFPDTVVVVFSAASDPGILAKARKAGVTGFLAKSRSVSEIADVLRKIESGQPVFDPVPHTASRPSAPFVLTPREEEVLHRIATGQDTRQMAHEMDIAVSTLRTYIKNVFAKIGVHSRLEAAAVASRANRLRRAGPLAHLPSGVFSPLHPGVSPVMNGARGCRHGGRPLHPAPGANLR